MSSNENTPVQLQEFGKLIYNMGVLFLIVIGINVGYFFTYGLISDFFYYAEIVVRILQYILIIVILMKANTINETLIDQDLQKFYTTGLISVIIAIACYIWSFFITVDTNVIESLNPEDTSSIYRLLELMIPLFLNMFVNWVGYIFGFISWKSLSSFFQKVNSAQTRNYTAISGVNKIKNGYLMFILGFLIIPILIAPFLLIAGYFQLGGYLKTISSGSSDMGNNINQPFQQSQVFNSNPNNMSAPPVNSRPDRIPPANFCSRCGSQFEEINLKFCPTCGNKINSSYE